VKESGEPSTKLEFDGLDDILADGGHPGGKGTCQLPPEEVGEDGKGEEGVEDGEAESKSRMESKPPAFGEYNENGRCATTVHFLSHHTDQMPQPQLETTVFVAFIDCR